MVKLVFHLDNILVKLQVVLNVFDNEFFSFYVLVLEFVEFDDVRAVHKLHADFTDLFMVLSRDNFDDVSLVLGKIIIVVTNFEFD